jgi:TusA-related sulfurtransferase
MGGLKMKPNERLEIATQVIEARSQDADILNRDELARLAADINIKPDDIPTLAGIIVYIRKRLIEKSSRLKAFKAAFPERCVLTGNKSRQYGRYQAADKVVGDPLDNSTIEIKAKRLENRDMYKQVYALLQTSLNIVYAVDRLRVLEAALDVALDDATPLRDRDRYMKLFLEETRKSENAQQLELNFNLTQNNVSIQSVEEKMNTIAQAMNHATAGEIVEVLHNSTKAIQDRG